LLRLDWSVDELESDLTQIERSGEAESIHGVESQPILHWRSSGREQRWSIFAGDRWREQVALILTIRIHIPIITPP
jgi:hypothetical protein